MPRCQVLLKLSWWRRWLPQAKRMKMTRSLVVEQNPSAICHRCGGISRVLRALGRGRRDAARHGGQGVVYNPAQHDGEHHPRIASSCNDASPDRRADAHHVRAVAVAHAPERVTSALQPVAKQHQLHGTQTCIHNTTQKRGKVTYTYLLPAAIQHIIPPVPRVATDEPASVRAHVWPERDVYTRPIL